jgi:multicomponent Na+:H+ antiporter subunit E
MEQLTRWNLTRVILTAVYLWFGWLLFSWSVEPASLIIGAVFSAGIALLTYPVFIEHDEAERRSHVPRVRYLLLYLLLLIFQMYVASFKVLWQVVRGRINPGVVHFRTRLRSDIARVALTNSITLTPGTITLLLDDDHLIVHWLDARTTHSRYAWNLVARPFESLLRRIWV